MTFYKDGRIYYDSIGNPTQYYNSASFEWAKGRQLQRVQLADGTYLSFRYNDEGVRTRKTVNGVETYFYLDGTNILAQKTGNDILWFNYDANGTRISITMPNGAVYYYAYNAQGDVIGLYSVNQYGYFVPQVYYTYDAWGKVLSITGNMADTLGQQNPFRYRGYYYDSETQFYYLNSRYYDPEVGRFINADEQFNDDILGNNIFIYCGNNPVNRSDYEGQGWWIVAGAVIGLLAGGITKVISNIATGNQWNEGVLGAALGGAVAGAVTAGTGSLVAGSFAGAAVESATNEILSYTPLASINGTNKKSLNKQNVISSVCDVFKDTAVEGTLSVLTGKIAGKLIPTGKTWIKPKKFTSSFFGKYAQKSMQQSIAQSGVSYGITVAKDTYGKISIQTPTVTIFPDTTITALE